MAIAAASIIAKVITAAATVGVALRLFSGDNAIGHVIVVYICKKAREKKKKHNECKWLNHHV